MLAALARLRTTAWCVYFLRCGDGTLYCGITNDLPKRLSAHEQGKGARYTRGRAPLTLAHCEQVADRSEALKREAALKRLTRAEKLRLIAKKSKKVRFKTDASATPSRDSRRRRRKAQRRA